MKLIALVTLVTPGGETPPGDEIDIKDEAEAGALIERGFAEAAPVEPPKAKAAKSEAGK